MNKAIPKSFKPILWSFKWDEIDVLRDKEDIILNTVNEGTLEQWHWIIETYTKETIKKVLSKRFMTEFHKESYNLARNIFDLPTLQNAR